MAMISLFILCLLLMPILVVLATKLAIEECCNAQYTCYGEAISETTRECHNGSSIEYLADLAGPVDRCNIHSTYVLARPAEKLLDPNGDECAESHRKLKELKTCMGEALEGVCKTEDAFRTSPKTTLRHHTSAGPSQYKQTSDDFMTTDDDFKTSVETTKEDTHRASLKATTMDICNASLKTTIDDASERTITDNLFSASGASTTEDAFKASLETTPLDVDTFKASLITTTEDAFKASLETTSLDTFSASLETTAEDAFKPSLETTTEDALKASTETTAEEASKALLETTAEEASQVSLETTTEDALKASIETTAEEASQVSLETTTEDAFKASLQTTTGNAFKASLETTPLAALKASLKTTARSRPTSTSPFSVELTTLYGEGNLDSTNNVTSTKIITDSAKAISQSLSPCCKAQMECFSSVDLDTLKRCWGGRIDHLVILAGGDDRCHLNETFQLMKPPTLSMLDRKSRICLIQSIDHSKLRNCLWTTNIGICTSTATTAAPWVRMTSMPYARTTTNPGLETSECCQARKQCLVLYDVETDKRCNNGTSHPYIRDLVGEQDVCGFDDIFQLSISSTLPALDPKSRQCSANREAFLKFISCMASAVGGVCAAQTPCCKAQALCFLTADLETTKGCRSTDFSDFLTSIGVQDDICNLRGTFGLKGKPAQPALDPSSPACSANSKEVTKLSNCLTSATKAVCSAEMICCKARMRCFQLLDLEKTRGCYNGGPIDWLANVGGEPDTCNLKNIFQLGNMSTDRTTTTLTCAENLESLNHFVDCMSLAAKGVCNNVAAGTPAKQRTTV